MPEPAFKPFVNTSTIIEIRTYSRVYSITNLRRTRLQMALGIVHSPSTCSTQQASTSVGTDGCVLFAGLSLHSGVI